MFTLRGFLLTATNPISDPLCPSASLLYSVRERVCVPGSPRNPALRKAPIGREKTAQGSVITYGSRQQHCSGSNSNAIRNWIRRPSATAGSQRRCQHRRNKTLLWEHGVTVLSNNSTSSFPLQQGAQFRRP